MEQEPAEQPFYVNAKQFHRILKRRSAREKLEESLKIARGRRPYLHESRHKHAMRRPRGQGGRFLTAAEIAERDRLEAEKQSQGKPGSSGSSSADDSNISAFHPNISTATSSNNTKSKPVQSISAAIALPESHASASNVSIQRNRPTNTNSQSSLTASQKEQSRQPMDFNNVNPHSKQDSQQKHTVADSLLHEQSHSSSFLDSQHQSLLRSEGENQLDSNDISTLSQDDLPNLPVTLANNKDKSIQANSNNNDNNNLINGNTSHQPLVSS